MTSDITGGRQMSEWPQPTLGNEAEIRDATPGPSSAPRVKRGHSQSSTEPMIHVPKRQRHDGSPEDEGYGAWEINEGAMVNVARASLICTQELRGQGS